MWNEILLTDTCLVGVGKYNVPAEYSGEHIFELGMAIQKQYQK